MRCYASPPRGATLPLPTLLLFTFGSGLATALADAAELRATPRAALATRGFLAYSWFAWCLLVPTATFYYLFYGDWFLLYLLDVERIPSALALFGFLGLYGFGALGFQVGASLVRAQHEVAAGGLLAATILGALLAPLPFRGRLGVMGTYEQFHGRYGLRPVAEGPLLPATYWVGALLLAGLLALIARIRWGRRSWRR